MIGLFISFNLNELKTLILFFVYCGYMFITESTQKKAGTTIADRVCVSVVIFGLLLI